MSKDPSVRGMLSQFSSDTSLHGIKHIFSGSKLTRRLFYAGALLSMIIFLVIIVQIQVVKFMSYPFYTVSTLKELQQTPFPSVTICNNNLFRFSYVSNDPAAMLSLRASYDTGPAKPTFNLSDPAFSSPNTECDSFKFFKAAAHQLTTMFRFCTWMREEVNCSEVFTPRLTSYGYCYTFNSQDYIAARGTFTATGPGGGNGLMVVMDIEEHEYFYGPGSSTGIKVLVHDHDYVPDMMKKGFLVAPGTKVAAGISVTKVLVHDHDYVPDMMKKGFLVAPGTKVAAGISVTKVKCLPHPYMAMGNNECLNTNHPNFKSPLTFYPTYDMNACITECKSRRTIEACNCQNHLDNAVNVSRCSLRQLVQCYYPATARSNAMTNKELGCDCKRECEWTNYDVSISSGGYPTPYDAQQLMESRNISLKYVKRNYLSLSVFYQQMWYTEIKQEAAYTFVDIVANLGGQLGIFLGASFLTLTEVVEYLIGIVCMACNKPKKTRVVSWEDGKKKTKLESVNTNGTMKIKKAIR